MKKRFKAARLGKGWNWEVFDCSLKDGPPGMFNGILTVWGVNMSKIQQMVLAELVADLLNQYWRKQPRYSRKRP